MYNFECDGIPSVEALGTEDAFQCNSVNNSVSERVCAPLKPQQPSQYQSALPPGGAVFASDHYPVWADVALGE